MITLIIKLIMKRLLIILACVISLNVSAQQKPFKIDGEINGAITFKYVYAFDNAYKLIQRAEIKNGKFLLEDSYEITHRFGEPAFAVVAFSNEENSDAIIANGSLSNRKHYNCRVILEDNISLKYNTENKTFELKGGASNKVQNKFVGVYTNYRNRRDSAYSSIEKLDTDNEETKVSEAKRLFTEALFQMIKLVSENPDSEVALFNFSPIIYDQSITAAIVQKAFNQFSERIKNSEYGIYIRKDVDDKVSQEMQMANPPYAVGMKFPYFELVDHQNKMIKNNVAFGKYTLIDFWATWCGPCRQETPNLLLAEGKFKTKGFKVVAISIDESSDQKKWLEVIESDKMRPFINLFNGNDKSGLAKELKIVAIPANFLIDSEGRIVAMNLRGEALQSKLRELMPN